jgi:hypothetical protein
MAAKDTSVAYATWTQPGTQFAVSYSLAVFHEIDFVVNEGYRRIPHGGIEVGGVLFGRREGRSVRLEAFRNIECEHASGPSFTLSERDVASLKEQLANAASDPELEGLQAVGWFIAHTRSELRMNEREAALFDELFPNPGSITLLIKPERFQPTRFGFLIREPDGRVGLDATEHAIILPLPGRADRTPGSDAIPPLPAASTERPAPESSIENEGRRDLPAEPKQGSSERLSAEPTRTISHRLSMALSRQPLLPETPPEALSAYARESAGASTEALVKTRALPALEEIRRVRAAELQTGQLHPGEPKYQIRPGKQSRKRLGVRLPTALLIAAALGCALGYWAYQRLSPTAIPLTIEPRPSTLLLSWPVEETRDSGSAVLKIDDGNPMPLTPEQRNAGEAEISVAGDNLKIELIVSHRIGDARGIVRYVRASKPPFPENP